MDLALKRFYLVVILGLSCVVHLIRGDGWNLVFKAVTGAPGNVYDLYMGSDTSNQTKLEALNTSEASEKKHFKSDLINHWSSLDINKVRVAIIKNQTERAFFLFNGTSTTRSSWFSQKRLLDTSYIDLRINTTTNYFAIDGYYYITLLGQLALNRRFYINSNYGSCNRDAGWLLVVDSCGAYSCSYENCRELPAIIYSPLSTKATYTKGNIADSMEVYVNFITKEVTTETTTTDDPTTMTEAVTKPKEAIQLEELTKELKINRKNTNKYQRTLISPYESRIPAVTMGIIGITVISCVCGFFICMDCITFGRYICEKIKINKNSIDHT